MSKPTICMHGCVTASPRAGVGRTLLWALGMAQVVALLGSLAGGRLGMSFRPIFGDALFVAGGLLLILAGLLDIAGSVTAAHIRVRPRIGDPPPAIRHTRRRYGFMLAGVLLCLEGVVLAHVF